MGKLPYLNSPRSKQANQIHSGRARVRLQLRKAMNCAVAMSWQDQLSAFEGRKRLSIYESYIMTLPHRVRRDCR